VQITLEASDAHTLEQMLKSLPSTWRAGEAGAGNAHFRLTTIDAVSYGLDRDGIAVASGPRDATLETFDRLLRRHIAASAPEHVFVHAGTVAHQGRAIVMPGLSFSGKTTLVAALVRAGASYYSDEYAVLDASGLLHPYPKPLSIRLEGDQGRQTDHDVSRLGGVAGVDPIPIGLVVSTHYHPGAEWRPTELSPSETVLELVPHTFPIGDRLAASLEVLGRAVGSVITLKGERGDADETAALILERFPGHP
jgi:hypothetical protein